MRTAVIAITLLLHLSCHSQSVVGFLIPWFRKNTTSAKDINVYVPVSAPVPALSMEHESKKFKIQIYSDKICKTYSGTFEGEIKNGQEENVDTPKGKCLWFVLPFPSGCKLHLERKTGQIQQFGRDYTAGTMLRGSFKSIGIECGQKDYSAKNKDQNKQPGR
ncbi:hypothetical protein F5876DRAFT_68731 [Lentinula aff. lateritia]|uniref:Uncharacterized protein n=1 Tax=Lentinula aff. lateritia TaxID=2804960 RepID=A0ACC1TPN0_9AGAR|nr:hypothetical protein F5876DRAFT_68731 [Lentinula aff. lateritia]